MLVSRSLNYLEDQLPHGAAWLRRHAAGRASAQLRSNHDEPDRMAEHHSSHAVDIEAQVADGDAKNDEWGNDAAVNGNTATESSVAQRGDGPKNNCHRGSDGIDAREALIDLKNAGDHDLPLACGGRNVAHHMLHDIRNDEPAYRRGDHDGDTGETVGNDCCERKSVGCG